MAEDSQLDALSAALMVELDAYAAGKQKFIDHLAGMFGDAPDEADRLLSLADEFGRDHSLEALDSDAAMLGASVDPELRSVLAADLDALAEIHDRVDDGASRRDAVLRLENPDRPRTIAIQGQLYSIDPDFELRPIEVSLVETKDDPGRELSLTQQVAREQGIGPAEPSSADRIRPRSR